MWSEMGNQNVQAEKVYYKKSAATHANNLKTNYTDCKEKSQMATTPPPQHTCKRKANYDIII